MSAPAVVECPRCNALRSGSKETPQPHPHHVVQAAGITGILCPVPDLVLECGDCGRVYGPDESHECRAQVRRNTRTCPSCKRPGVLTAREAARGYQCRACTRRAEGYGFES